MYDMYPDGWPASSERRGPQPTSERPRRRARKPHSVQPAVIALGSSGPSRDSAES